MENFEKIHQEIKIKEIITRLIIVIGIICLIAFFIFSWKKYKSTLDENNLYQRLQDSIKTYINDKGQLVSQIEILQANSTRSLLNLKTKDETINWLQQEVKNNKEKIKSGGSISVIGTQVSFTGINGTIVTFDSSIPVKKGDTLYMYPIYSSKSKDSTWINYNINANKDTTILNLKVNNKYSVLIGSTNLNRKERKEKGINWFNRKIPIVEVTNQNPYDNTKTLRAFEVKDTRKSRLGLGLGVGVGVTPKGFQPYLGIGLQYTVIKF